MVKIGIPRALLYYQYYPMWKAFLEEMGAETVLSPPTTEPMLTAGSARVVGDTCLPVKVFIGHVLSLADKCDYIFIPAITSVRPKVYNCPKFLGLPETARATVPESPAIIDTHIDINKGEKELWQAIRKLGRLFTHDDSRIRRAVMIARQAHMDYRQLMSSQRLNSVQAMERMSASLQAKHKSSASPPTARHTIAVVGHPYILHDELISHRLVARLEQFQGEVLMPEMVSAEELESAVCGVVGRVYWAFEDELLGAAGHYLGNGVDGVIAVTAFGCGPDSLMLHIVGRQAKLSHTPYTSLVIDEHTADAGMVTRLEAFLDMLHRRKN